MTPSWVDIYLKLQQSGTQRLRLVYYPPWFRSGREVLRAGSEWHFDFAFLIKFSYEIRRTLPRPLWSVRQQLRTLDFEHATSHKSHAHAHTHTHICAHAHTHTHTHTYTRTRTRTRTHTHTYTRTRTRTHTYTHTYTRTRTHTHTHIYARAHAHKHAHEHSQTRTLTQCMCRAHICTDITVTKIAGNNNFQLVSETLRVVNGIGTCSGRLPHNSHTCAIASSKPLPLSLRWRPLPVA